MNLGSLLIVAAGLCGAVAFVSALRWARGQVYQERLFRWAYGGMTVALAAASLLLLRALLSHDFRYDYVIGYTSRDLPLLYLISAFWGGQEGTYLLWALFAALLGYPLFRKGAWQAPAVMAGYTPTVALLIGFMLNPGGNPFRLAAQVPLDGRGLNPLLQDPWMASHPPVIFLGYAAMTVPAVLAWVAAFRRDEKTWGAPALRYALLGFLTLGAGIILGGIWAYKVLGWGGFWGWDPVENASLVPWIISAALIHGLLVQQSAGALRRTNLVLAMAGYLLVVYATFLTRSGVLANFSVHSFPASSIYGWLVAAMVAVASVSVLALLMRRAPAGTPMDSRLAWPMVLSITIGLLVVSALFVLVGTSWPIITSIFGQPAILAIPFYNQVNFPVYVVMLGLLGLGPFLAWIPLPTGAWLRRFVPALMVAIGGTGVAFLLGGHGAGNLLLFGAALLALTANLIRLVEVGRRRPLHTGAALTHLGFALMFVGIVAGEAWDRTERVRLPIGEPVEAFGRVLTYHGHEHGSDPEHRWRIEVEEADGSRADANVTFYQRPDGQTFKKPAIQRYVAGDFYLAPAYLEFGHNHGETLTLARGEPFSFGDATLTFERFEMPGATEDGGLRVHAIVRVAGAGGEERISLALVVTGGEMEGIPTPSAQLGIPLTLQRISVEAGRIEVSVPETGSRAQELLIVDASVKPLIGVLWAGSTLLLVGCALAFVRRSVDWRTQARQRLSRRAEAAKAGRTARAER